jgi:N6-adenosine-specific RNA methylase IME4
MKYKLIYADPPWQFSNKNTGGSMGSGAANQYRVTSIKDLKAIDVNSIADTNCLLVMWWVGSMPQEAIALVGAWGFTIKNMNGFVWRKLTRKRRNFFGMGFYTRAGSESCIIAVKGKPPILSHSVRAVHTRMAKGHSEKPDVFRDLCVELTGDVPRLEMFARKSSGGWDLFGDQAPSSIDIANKVKVVA